MKAQAVNIDWTVGLGLFLVSLVSGLLLFSNTVAQSSQVPQNREKASLVHQKLEDQTFVEGRKAPLVVRTTANTSNVPVDTDYVFHENAYVGSGAMEVSSEINISGDRIVTVVDAANASHSLSYFFSNTTNLSYSNSIDTGSWMNNSQVSVKPGSPGIESLRVSGNEILNPDAELNGNSFSVTEHELHASTLSGDLKLYNNTPELILEDPGEVTFHLKNFSTLYWHRDGSTTDLAGTGTFKDGNTSAFTVATYSGNSYGVTFLGDELNATVSKPTGSEVKAVIETGRLRINLHNSDYKAGENRSEMFTEGDVFFGAEEVIEGAKKEEIERLDNLSENRFENQLSLGDFEYDIEFGNLSRGSQLPFKDVVVSDRPSVMLGRYGNYSRIESVVKIWR